MPEPSGNRDDEPKIKNEHKMSDEMSDSTREDYRLNNVIHVSYFVIRPQNELSGVVRFLRSVHCWLSSIHQARPFRPRSPKKATLGLWVQENCIMHCYFSRSGLHGNKEIR